MFNYFSRALNLLPIALPAMVAGFGLVAMALLLFGQLQTWLAWPLGLLVALAIAAILWRAKPAEVQGGRRENLICSVLLIVGVLMWGLFNSYYASEHLFTNRDPATYANAAIWLINHDNLQIETPAIFGDSPNITNETPGFEHPQGQNNVVHAQGQHLVPVLLGLAGRIVGEDWVLRLSPWLGAVALMAVYGFARFLVKPRWALLTTAVLAATLPMIHFSRDVYTEPLSIAFVFAGLSLLWQAQKTNGKPIWFVAGLVAGAGALARIDSYMVIIGLAAFLVVLLAVVAKGRRKEALRGVGVFSFGAVLPLATGWLDLTQLSAPYFAGHWPLVLQELVVLLAVVVLGAAAVFISWRTELVSWLNRVTKTWRVPVLVAVIVAIVLVLISRPLWYAAPNNSGEIDGFVASIQMTEGLAVEARSYAELSTYWVSWYVGPIIAIAAVFGLIVLMRRLFEKGDLLPLAFIFVFLVAAVYFIKPNVAPDQLWATRRMLPVLIPSVIILGIYALYWLSQKQFLSRMVRHAVLPVAAVAVLIAPLATNSPFVRTRDVVQTPLFEDLCNSLPANSAVLWLGDGWFYNVQATRSLCGVPAAAYTNGRVSQQELIKTAVATKEAGYVPVVAVFAGDKHLAGEVADMTPVSAYTYHEMAPTITSPPKKVESKSYEFLIGAIGSDGSISAVQ